MPMNCDIEAAGIGALLTVCLFRQRNISHLFSIESLLNVEHSGINSALWMPAVTSYLTSADPRLFPLPPPPPLILRAERTVVLLGLKTLRGEARRGVVWTGGRDSRLHQLDTTRSLILHPHPVTAQLPRRALSKVRFYSSLTTQRLVGEGREQEG